MTVPSVIILGTDVAIAAAPATPVQLALACQAFGYDAVIPASWGDELVASRVLERVRGTEAPLVQCSCPHVAERLAEAGDSLGPLLLCLVSPPVATAEYVRALYAPVRPTITFAGGCPSAIHPSIDVSLSAEELLASLDSRGISPRNQPTEFDSIIPPDRRRFFSEPGGVPSRHALRQVAGGIDLAELRDDDVVVDLAQHLLQKSRVLIDASLPLGCTCSGKVTGIGTDAARAQVRRMEPPRAPSPVVDHTVRLSLDVPSPPSFVAPATPPALPPPRPRTELPAPDEGVSTVELSRRRSPPVAPRAVLGTMPLARTEAGRSLPRAYVARRRSSPTSNRRIEPVGRVHGPASPASFDVWKRWAIAATIGLVLGLMVAWVIRSLL